MKQHSDINDKLASWIAAQPMFFVGTAPLAGDGHVNVSPKGLAGTFRILEPLRVAYLDYTGSGAETVAHLRENGRVVIMFCAFNGPPQIVRLHGAGRAVFAADPDFARLRSRFDRDDDKAIRAIIDVTVSRVTDSCGYTVPTMELRGERQLLDQWASRKTPEQLEQYWTKTNATSIDGLPAVRV